jgi:two-component system sensor histidine kinase KdpD
VRIKTEEMRSGLLSAVSHDLRTPLASITGAATSLLGQGEKFSAETRQELLESIADEAERLGRLVNNLLEMTRLDSGTAPVARDWYSVEKIVGATLQRLTKILAKHPVTARLPEDLPLVYVDEVLIGQVLANLLENAAKYTAAGTAIEIAAFAEGETVTVAVSDRGPGFAAEDVGRVFEKFYRGRADGVRGVGLGLAIAHAIVSAHGGTMEAANRPEGGAQIRFTLAASAAPAP